MPEVGVETIGDLRYGQSDANFTTIIQSAIDAFGKALAQTGDHPGRHGVLAAGERGVDGIAEAQHRRGVAPDVDLPARRAPEPRH